MEIGEQLKIAIKNIRDINDISQLIEKSEKFHSVEIGDIGHFNVSRYKSKGSKEPSKPQKVKIGRFFRNVLEDFDDYNIEDISNKMIGYNKVSFGDIELKILKGDDIINIYQQENYYDRCGTLGNSCMRHSNKKDFLHLYSKNENCEVIVNTIDDKITSRALLWTLDNGTKFIDRVYSIYDYMVNVYEDYAIKNGYGYNKNGLCLVLTDGEYIRTDINLTISNMPEKFPYMDTLSVLYNNRLYSYLPEVEDGVYDYKGLRQTDGSYSENRLPRPLERGITESYRQLLSNERTQWLVDRTKFIEDDIQFIYNLSDRSFIKLKFNIEKIINTNSKFPSNLDELNDILLMNDINNFKLGLYKSIDKDYPEHFYNEDGSIIQELAEVYNSRRNNYEFGEMIDDGGVWESGDFETISDSNIENTNIQGINVSRSRRLDRLEETINELDRSLEDTNIVGRDTLLNTANDLRNFISAIGRGNR